MGDDNESAERENSARQASLIHVFWGYHSDRMRHGHPFALGNSLKDTKSLEHDTRYSLSAFMRNVQQHGYKAFNLLDFVRQQGRHSPLSMITEGVIASTWDSLNHVIGEYMDHASPQYHDFLVDSELTALKNDIDTNGERLFSFGSSRTLHAGISVGVSHTTTLAAIEYGLPAGHPFNTPQLAHTLAKTDTIRLTALSMADVLLRLRPTVDTLGMFQDPHAPLGYPSARLRKHCDPKAIGCSARSPITPQAESILRRHGLYDETYGNAEGVSAIRLISTAVKNFLRREIDDLFSALSLNEVQTKIEESDRLILTGALVGNAQESD